MVTLRKQNYALHAHQSIIALEGAQFHPTKVAYFDAFQMNNLNNSGEFLFEVYLLKK